MIKTNLERFFNLSESRLKLIKSYNFKLKIILILSIISFIASLCTLYFVQATTLQCVLTIFIIILLIYYGLIRRDIKNIFIKQLLDENRQYAIKNFKLLYSSQDETIIILLSFALIILIYQFLNVQLGGV